MEQTRALGGLVAVYLWQCDVAQQEGVEVVYRLGGREKIKEERGKNDMAGVSG